MVKSLGEFITEKSEDRTCFSSKKKKGDSTYSTKKSVRSKQKEITESRVTINIGIIRENDHGILAATRGSKLPVLVNKDSTANQVLVAAITKHSNHDQYFCAAEEYVLLYPDQKVVVKVPGSEEHFTVAKYKKELAKPYNRCDLYLCKLSDISTSVGEEVEEIERDKNELFK